ncbi:hypothetical protein XP2010_17020 [Xanthomonas perforans]|nr:hypothetical protein XP2010_17020 [Xanthomonas perforans]
MAECTSRHPTYSIRAFHVPAVVIGPARKAPAKGMAAVASHGLQTCGLKQVAQQGDQAVRMQPLAADVAPLIDTPEQRALS